MKPADAALTLGKMRGGLVAYQKPDTTDPNKTYIGAYSLTTPTIDLNDGVGRRAMTQEYAPSGGAAGLWNFIQDFRATKLPVKATVRTQGYDLNIVPGRGGPPAWYFPA
jgi:hypothetical protein